VGVDEHPRPDLTAEQLAKLRPVFREGGTVTAGNSSGLNDGSAALLVVSDEFAKANGLKPLAVLVSSAVAGVEPDMMGIGPIPAGRRALERAGVAAADLAAVELNEAFAAQALPCIDQLGLDPDRVNPLGGAIALGHPLGCTGAKILTTLVHELVRSGGGHGMATMCIGDGQGLATVIEASA
jgi:acetyl-CoA C-acetyltransferase/3-oxo-5,6-didehydrosuberyl-CoA/3-oxoadipyl-CoA thiolase